METILVGIDDSTNARQALRWALDHSDPDDTVVAIHTWDLPPMSGFDAAFLDPAAFEEGAEATARAVISEVVGEGGEDIVSPRVLRGTAAGTLIEEARTADMLVVGARGRGGFAGLILGSVTSSIVNHAPCPVVVVPSHAVDPAEAGGH